MNMISNGYPVPTYYLGGDRYKTGEQRKCDIVPDMSHSALLAVTL